MRERAKSERTRPFVLFYDFKNYMRKKELKKEQTKGHSNTRKLLNTQLQHKYLYTKNRLRRNESNSQPTIWCQKFDILPLLQLTCRFCFCKIYGWAIKVSWNIPIGYSQKVFNVDSLMIKGSNDSNPHGWSRVQHNKRNLKNIPQNFKNLKKRFCVDDNIIVYLLACFLA